MTKKYKRKFKVPGDTIRSCRSFQKKCRKEYPNRAPCNSVGSYRRDKSKCPYPIGKPNEYIVSETINGEWQCSCPSWKFRRRQCHHIAKAKANPEKYEIAVEFTERTTDVLSKIFEN